MQVAIHEVVCRCGELEEQQKKMLRVYRNKPPLRCNEGIFDEGRRKGFTAAKVFALVNHDRLEEKFVQLLAHQ